MSCRLNAYFFHCPEKQGSNHTGNAYFINSDKTEARFLRLFQDVFFLLCVGEHFLAKLFSHFLIGN